MPLRRCFRLAPIELRLALALAGLLVGVLFLTQSFSPAHAAGPRYVAPSGADSGDCRNSNAPCATPQYAVDVAQSGDEIRLAAGTYTGVQTHAGISQTVYLSKTLTIHGGYTLTNWDIPDPIAHPTTLDAHGRGRVLYITGNISPTIEGLRLVNGDATVVNDGYPGYSDGGGMLSITATTTLRNSAVVGNRGINGGGVSVLFGTLRISGSTIAENSTRAGQTGGGGISLFGSTALLENNQILSNTAQYVGFPTPVPAPSMGGGLLIYNSIVTLRGNTIAGNRAYREGGGLDVVGSTITMTGNLIADNRVESAVGAGGGMSLRRSSGAVSSNSIIRNRSHGAAGGVDLAGSSNIVLHGNTIAYNGATSGGGVVLNGSDTLLDSDHIIHNTALDGGGMLLGDSSPIIINTVIADNTADNGSGIYVSIGAPHMIQMTIARNTASNGRGGNGIFISRFSEYYTANLTLINSILVGHATGISVTAGVTATLDGVLWFGNGANLSSDGTTTIANAVTGDPVFAADGYHLTACSAARRRGIDAGVMRDIDGDPRPPDAIDLGADQFVANSAPCRKVYLPIVRRA